MIHLNQRSSTPLYEQIYTQLSRDILLGVYPPASKLPSIRELAEELRCSRNTVDAAYRLLAQEGFTASKPGSGFIVEDMSGETAIATRAATWREEQQASEPTLPSIDLAPARYDFTYGNLEPGTFPAAAWRSILNDILLEPDLAQASSYDDDKGEWALRCEIARRAQASRDIHCSAENIIVQGGTQPTLQRLCLLFDTATDAVAMEEPGYDGARSVFEGNGFPIRLIPVTQGADAMMAALHASDAKLLYVTPANQFPTGGTMSPEVREGILTWAKDTDAYIIEDDYCHEFCYRGERQPALFAQDNADRVIYLGTFSKALSPALRISYMILPKVLRRQWDEKFSNAYPAVSWLMQEALARYLASGQWDRHLRRLQARSRRKHTVLMDTIKRTMEGKVRVLEHGCGLHVLLEVLDGRSQGELIALAREEGVRVYGTDRYWTTDGHTLGSCVLVGFSAIPEQDIEPGIEALARAWFTNRR
ncbi:MocR-like pyridoxine biosynthesis transcription factor PdxR [Adlercreutzia sp. ZJ141]|uniref:MocR-like pyridoxine biosynthesis transcription factor PdxR n=1 Tax=Adlercreutzia sp. ZJ141 TaxID=2709406 RepID=UPI0013E9DCD4|nr:PLP-dependent aminotransferase family protein [Adlercreutzia sp. ZJ141]